MSTVKIPQLPDAGALTGNELLIVDQNVSTRKATLALVSAYISSQLPPITASQLASVAASLPTTDPGIVGQLWNNGGIITISR